MSQYEDIVLPFSLSSTGIRGRLVKLGPSLGQALKRHSYPTVVSQMLGEFLALGAMLSTTIKYEGTLTIQINSDGPINLLVSNVSSAGVMRGYANFDKVSVEELLLDKNSDCLSIKKIIGEGHLAFTVDQGPDMERYQGIVALEGDTLASCAKQYFYQSEQIVTDVIIMAAEYGGYMRSGAIMLQKLPESQVDTVITKQAFQTPDNSQDKVQFSEVEEDWNRATMLMSSIKYHELLNPNISAQSLAFRLFHSEKVCGFSERKIKFGCQCSRDTVKRTLQAFTKTDIEEMFIDNEISVKCQFCGSEETFNKQDLEDLYLDSRTYGS